MSPLEQIEFWHWWIAGVLLAILEIFIPGAILIWMGLAAGLVGALALAVPGLPWQAQFLIFSLLSVSSIVVWRFYQRRHPTETDQPLLNRRGEQYVGKVFTLEEAIVNGTGAVKVGDSRWKVQGAEELPAGARVRVTGVEGTILQVEAEAAG